MDIVWENKQVSIDADDNLNDRLNYYGKNGWEVISLDRRYDGRWLLCTLVSMKRQKPSNQKIHSTEKSE